VSERPLVSVIIPNHNYAKTLGECLAAVFDQTYQPLEVIVVDDGSTDDSVAVAKRFPCRLERTANGGVSAARNLGARLGNGEILFFLDSDIQLRPDAVATAVALLESEPSAGMVCGVYDWVPFVDDGPVERYKVLHGHYWRVRCAGETRMAFLSLGAVRRPVFDQAGPLDESLRYTEDVEYGARLSVTSRIVLSPYMVGRHDDDDRLSVLLRKQFTRSVPLVALFADRGPKRPQLGDTAYRPLGAAASALAVVGLPLALLSPWYLLSLPAGLAAFAAVERGLLGFVLAKAGLRFTPRFFALHLLMNLTTVTAAGLGALKWMTSRRFRHLYRQIDAVRRDTADA
jgi:glycosyltransferase involved in cell wall biosynthesis